MLAHDADFPVTGPVRYAIVDGMMYNYPPQWTAAPSQELLVIRRNPQIGEVSIDPLRCRDPKGGRKPINAKCETVRSLQTFRYDAWISEGKTCCRSLCH